MVRRDWSAPALELDVAERAMEDAAHDRKWEECYALALKIRIAASELCVIFNELKEPQQDSDFDAEKVNQAFRRIRELQSKE